MAKVAVGGGPLGAAQTLVPARSGRGAAGDPEPGLGAAGRAATPGQDSQGQSPRSSSGGPASAAGFTLPSTMKVLGDDGKVEVISLGIGAADGVSHCCGLPPPPGGWYGPFGFFRLVSFAMAGIAVFAVLLALLSLCFRDLLGFLSNVLLGLSAACCAVAAYAHEGLADEVTAMARQNDLFADKNEKLAKQNEQLGGVAQRLDSLQQSLGVDMQKLEDLLTSLHAVAATQQLATMVNAFTTADRYGTADQRLLGDEVGDFFGTCGDILKQAAPDFDFDELQREAAANGIGLAKMRFLVNAVVASGDAQPGRSTAMLCLVLFSADHEKYFEQCQEALRVVLKRCQAETIKTMLQEKVDTCADSNGRVSCMDLQDIAKRVMTEPM